MIKHRRFHAIIVALGVLLALNGCATSPSTSRTTERAAALAAFEAGDYGVASRLLQTYVDRYPEDADAWYRLGTARAQIDDLIAARDAFAAALARDPQLAPARYNLGLVHLRLGGQALREARRQLPADHARAATTADYLRHLLAGIAPPASPASCDSPSSTGDRSND